MPPTIRIDEEVYTWLQEHARPFEDTPNSVLRRMAGLDAAKKAREVQTMNTADQNQESTQSTKPSERVPLPSSTTKSKRALSFIATGQQLNEQWKVGARHALYHRDGHWYNKLERFPGALFDPDGYVVFRTEEEYLRSPHLRIGKQTNVPNGISSIPGYVRKGRV